MKIFSNPNPAATATNTRSIGAAALSNKLKTSPPLKGVSSYSQYPAALSAAVKQNKSVNPTGVASKINLSTVKNVQTVPLSLGSNKSVALGTQTPALQNIKYQLQNKPTTVATGGAPTKVDSTERVKQILSMAVIPMLSTVQATGTTPVKPNPTPVITALKTKPVGKSSSGGSSDSSKVTSVFVSNSGDSASTRQTFSSKAAASSYINSAAKSGKVIRGVSG